MDFEKEFGQTANAHLLRYFHEALGADKIEWEMLTIRNLAKVRECMEKTCAANSVVTYCAIIKSFLAQYTDTGLLPCGKDYKTALRAKKEPSEQIALTEDEMALIENYAPKSKLEREVKARFLCEYYSLARSCDIDNMTSENIDEDKRIIKYVAIKTKKQAIVPLHRNFTRYMNERGDTPKQWSFNKTIKRICKKCGINKKVKIFNRGEERTVEKWELVGSHTARRSGATNLAMRGVPIPVIAKMMSHGQDVEMTQRYIWIDSVNLDEHQLDFFN